MLLRNYWVLLVLTSSHLGHFVASQQECRKGITPLITAHTGTSSPAAGRGSGALRSAAIEASASLPLSPFLYVASHPHPSSHCPTPSPPPVPFLGTTRLNPLLLESLQNCLNDKEKTCSTFCFDKIIDLNPIQ